jgi:hypothetical protein
VTRQLTKSRDFCQNYIRDFHLRIAQSQGKKTYDLTCVDLADGGGEDGGSGEAHVEVLLDREGRRHTHVPDVQA